MASIALTVAGTAIGGPVGGIVGGVIGGLVDNYVLFPPPDQYGPRLGSLPVSGASEGTPVVVSNGSQVRQAGTVIYQSDWIEAENTQSAKGGPTLTTYTYSVDLAVAIGPGNVRKESRTINDLKKIYLDGDLFWDNVGTISETVSDITVSTYAAGYGWFDDTADYWVVYESAGAIDFVASGFVVGLDLTISGTADSDNSGTYRVTNANPAAPNRIEVYWGQYDITSPPSNLPSAESAGASVTFEQTPAKFSPSDATSVTVYKGTATQTVDPTLESHLGVGNTPAFTGTPYVVIEGLQGADFGNRVPNITFETEADASGYTRATTVSDALEDYGISSTEYDTSNVSGTHKGSYRRGPVSGDEYLGGLFLAYDLAAQESAGAISVYDWSALPDVAVTAADLAAHQAGSDIPRVVTYRNVRPDSLPSQIDVSYVDTTNGLQTGTQTDRWRSVITRVSDHVQQVNLPITLTPSEAKSIARRIRMVYLTGRTEVELQLPPTYMTLLANDMLSFTADGEDWSVRVERVQRGANGMVIVRGTREEDQAHSVSVSGEDANYTDPTISFPAPFLPAIVDIAPLRDEDATVPGYYYGAALTNPSTIYQGGQWYESRDGGTNFALVSALTAEPTIGRATTTLAAGVTNVWDSTNTFDVNFIQGTPTTKTQAQVLAGANWFAVGGEIVGVVTWTGTGGYVYRASTLLRGIRNTEARTLDHADDEVVVHVSGTQGAYFGELTLGDYGETYDYRAVVPGDDTDDAINRSHQHTLATIRPFGPYDVQGLRDASNNLAITWRPRTRAQVGIWTDSDVPLLEDSEVYELDILDGATVVRTITGDSSRAESYTAAQQTADGLTPGDPVDLVIYQVSSRGIGRGNGTEATV